MLTHWVRCADKLLLGTIARRVEQSVNETLNLLLPTSCAVCEVPDRRLCRTCRVILIRGLQNIPVPPQLQTILELPGGQQRFLTCAVGLYANELARAILAFKNHQRLFLADLFAPYLAALANTLCPPQPRGHRVLLVPVPSSYRARATRGYWPVWELLRTAAHRGLLSPSFECRPLLRYRLISSFSPSQKSKTGRQRREASTALYAFDAVSEGQQIILVDDVLTTGATMVAAAQACTAAGYEVIGSIVVALTPPPNRD